MLLNKSEIGNYAGIASGKICSIKSDARKVLEHGAGVWSINSDKELS